MKKIDILREQIEIIREKYDDSIMAVVGEDQEEFFRLIGKMEAEMNPIELQIRELKEIEWNDIPSYGNHMPLEQFKDYCNDGMFIDYDGSGSLATKTKESNVSIHPSDVTGNNLVKLLAKFDGFTHVVWYNK